MKEVWKYIPGCEGRIEISNMGCYRKVGTKARKYGTRGNRGEYLCVHYKDNNGKDCWSQVHRIVAKVFCENPRNAPQVDHIDSNPRNNRADNLRWVFPKEQSRNSATSLKRRQPSLFSKQREKGVIVVRLDGKDIGYYHTVRDVASALGCSLVTIGRVLRKEQPSFRGMNLIREINIQLTLF